MGGFTLRAKIDFGRNVDYNILQIGCQVLFLKLAPIALCGAAFGLLPTIYCGKSPLSAANIVVCFCCLMAQNF